MATVREIREWLSKMPDYADVMYLEGSTLRHIHAVAADLPLAGRFWRVILLPVKIPVENGRKQEVHE